MILPVTVAHPFTPDALGTQCAVIGCWGWLDDPRHNAHERAAKPPVSLLGAPRSRCPRRRGRGMDTAEHVRRECGHDRRQHSIQGCLDGGGCVYGCKVKYTDKQKFEPK